MTELTVTLPDDLARKAREAGLLNAEGIERTLRDALKREAGRKLLEIGKSIQATDLPPITEEEIQAEIDAYRAEQRAKRATLDRLLAIARAPNVAGVEPMSGNEVEAELKAARADRRS